MPPRQGAIFVQKLIQTKKGFYIIKERLHLEQKKGYTQDKGKTAIRRKRHPIKQGTFYKVKSKKNRNQFYFVILQYENNITQ